MAKIDKNWEEQKIGKKGQILEDVFIFPLLIGRAGYTDAYTGIKW